MGKNTFATKSLENWFSSHPLLAPISRKEAVFWCNPDYLPMAEVTLPLGIQEIEQASARLSRFAPYLQKVFSDTRHNQGIIESPIIKIASMQQKLATQSGIDCQGQLWLKCDSHLPIAGSVKARGGIYEVLKHAEHIALAAGLLSLSDNYASLDSAVFKAFFSQHHIVVGSTGNLGLSIGIIGAQLGFKVSVHMSVDAKAWKKQLLRDKGVEVVEHAADYSVAVTQGRIDSEAQPNSHFIDDENSEDLFLGYAVAALRLKKQLSDQQIKVDRDHPLFVYLPCGVGGAPGGISFGLKQVFGDFVHCFFAEPCAAPCMLLGVYTQLHEGICVQDIGLDGVTCADGLAVGRPSALVGRTMQNILSGSYTLDDECLYQLLTLLKDTEKLALEPSALAGVIGMQVLSARGKSYLERQKLADKMHNSTHLAWATGGSMVPQAEFDQDYLKGEAILRSKLTARVEFNAD